MRALLFSLLLLSLPAYAQTGADILEQSAPGDWRRLPPEDLVYMKVPGGLVIFELATAFAPEHIKNIKTLVDAGYFDGLAIVRVQDNYVAQWGDPDGEKPGQARSLGKAKKKLPAEFARPSTGLPFVAHADKDVYADEVGWSGGFPAARDPKTGTAWLAHCYAAIGAGRNDPPDGSTGAELYAVIGHSPRHLDKNITLVGRVVYGIEHLSSLPRGPAPMGFYEKPEQRHGIVWARRGHKVPAADRLQLEALRTDSARFAAFVDARRNRREKWFANPVGTVELCNVPLPIREAKPAR